MKRLLLIAVVAFSTVWSASAQGQFDERYGQDPAKREQNARNYSFMFEAYKMKAFDDVLGFYRKLAVDAPKVSMNMYIWAAEIYRGKLARATTKAERAAYLDTIMIVFDQRIENFSDHAKYDHAYLVAQKALIFNESDPGNREKAFKLFRDALAVAGRTVDPDLVVTFFNSLTESYKLDDLTPEQYMTDYDNLSQLLSDVGTEESTKAAESIDALFGASGAASCENIEKIFRPKYEADPNNADLIKNILGLYQRGKCSTDFQLALTEKFYTIEPTPELASMLSSIYEGRKDFKKAAEYIKIAIAGEKDPARKLAMLLTAGNAALGDNQYREAADYARQAMALDDSQAGIAYLILAEAYAGGVRGACSGFDLQAAFWLVVDTYQQARAKLADQPAQVEHISKMIGTYASNFPKTEDVFMRGLNPGQGYTVSCGWVSGRTSVRER